MVCDEVEYLAGAVGIAKWCNIFVEVQVVDHDKVCHVGEVFSQPLRRVVAESKNFYRKQIEESEGVYPR